MRIKQGLNMSIGEDVHCRVWGAQKDRGQAPKPLSPLGLQSCLDQAKMLRHYPWR